MLYSRPPTFVQSGILSGIVLIFDLNCNIVGSVRTFDLIRSIALKWTGRRDFHMSKV